MKRLVWVMIATFSMTIILMAHMRQSIAEHRLAAKAYIAEGLYEEGMLEYYRSNLHLKLFQGTIHLLGKMNAFLALFGMLFILSGVFLEKIVPKNSLKLVRINEDFNWREHIL